jgi:hypothetical protein
MMEAVSTSKKCWSISTTVRSATSQKTVIFDAHNVHTDFLDYFTMLYQVQH